MCNGKVIYKPVDCSSGLLSPQVPQPTRQNTWYLQWVEDNLSNAEVKNNQPRVILHPCDSWGGFPFTNLTKVEPETDLQLCCRGQTEGTIEC